MDPRALKGSSWIPKAGGRALDWCKAKGMGLVREGQVLTGAFLCSQARLHGIVEPQVWQLHFHLFKGSRRHRADQVQSIGRSNRGMRTM
jgi:hypothetical protein